MKNVSSFQIPTKIVSCSMKMKKSETFVALGGEDQKIHVLPFFSGNLICLLEGHTTPVTAVTFDEDQKRIAAGSEGGSIRMWDLATSEGIRSFGTGHKAAVTCIDCHPFGEFLATGSRDTNMRIWDVRKKSCLQSYKNVTSELNVVKFCPSGKWVASGCAEGVVRLYDLTSGKPLNEFRGHKGKILSIAFHPEQFLLASSSADGTSALWDLENGQLLFTTQAEKAACSNVTFAEKNLLVTGEKMLKLYDFQSMSDRTAKILEAPWTVTSDLVYSSAQDEALAIESRGQNICMSRIALGRRPQDANPPALTDMCRVEKKRTTSPITVARPSPAAYNNISPQQRGAEEQNAPRKTNTLTSVNNGHLEVVATAAKIQEPVSHSPMISLSAAPMIPLSAAPSEMQLVEELLHTSTAMTSILQRRGTHTRVIRSMWPQDTRGALIHCQKIAAEGTECGLVVDLFVAMQNQRMKERITLELLPTLLFLVVFVLGSQKTEQSITHSIRVVRSMNSKFRAKMDEVLRGAAIRTGVDLSMEARIEKCKALMKQFDDVHVAVRPFALRKDNVGEEARTLLSELPQPRENR